MTKKGQQEQKAETFFVINMSLREVREVEELQQSQTLSHVG